MNKSAPKFGAIIFTLFILFLPKLAFGQCTGGTVAADQTICSGGDPATFTETAASTGTDPLTYQWQSSTTDCTNNFTNIGGATSKTYDPPSGLSTTTYYRRVTTANG